MRDAEEEDLKGDGEEVMVVEDDDEDDDDDDDAFTISSRHDAGVYTIIFFINSKLDFLRCGGGCHVV